MCRGHFLSFFALFFHTIVENQTKGGVIMDDDIYDMFLEIMDQIHTDDADGRMRVLSKDPRYAAEMCAATKPKTEKR